MNEPAQNRDMKDLHTIFRAPFEAWLEAAQGVAKHVNFIVTETLRTEERQAWLYKQGREVPYLDEPEATWTMDSRHRWGLAADFVMQRPDSGELIWTPQSYRWLYRHAPPAAFGLRHIGPREWVHLEYRWADEAIDEAGVIGLQQH